MARRKTPIIDGIVDRLTEDRPIVGAIVDGLRNAAGDPAAAITPEQVDAPVVEHVVAAIDANPTVAVVPVQSGLWSKINWTAAAGPMASFLAWVGLDVTAEQLVAIFFGVQAIQSVLTVVWKTWFTKTVTPQSAARPL